MNIGKSLKLALLLRETSQKEFAGQLNVHPQVVNRWCNADGAGMTLTTMEYICGQLELKVSEFIALGEE